VWLFANNHKKVFHLNSCATVRLYFGSLCTTVPHTSTAITNSFAINSVILFAISHILSTNYSKSNESSAGTSGYNIAILIFLKIHNIQWSHTSTKDEDMFTIGK
jgi:hypothetical protein